MGQPLSPIGGDQLVLRTRPTLPLLRVPQVVELATLFTLLKKAQSLLFSALANLFVSREENHHRCCVFPSKLEVYRTRCPVRYPAGFQENVLTFYNVRPDLILFRLIKIIIISNLEKVYVHRKIEFVTVNQDSLNYGRAKSFSLLCGKSLLRFLLQSSLHNSENSHS